MSTSFNQTRSWVHVVNNMAYLSEVQLEEWLHSLWKFEDIPEMLLPILPTFLHELTHHWCFHSPIGRTLSHLQLHARRRAMFVLEDTSETDGFENDPDKDVILLSRLLQAMLGEREGQEKYELQQDILEDVMRYETAMTLLRPISEGLALFAEFDIISRKSTVRSSVLEGAFQVFGAGAFRSLSSLETDRSEGPEELTDKILMTLLYHSRTSKECVDKKAGLFAQPLSLKDGGYLIGYLTVKRLWRIAISKYNRLLNETDLFFMFVRSYFYEDYELVALLLDNTLKGIAATNAILEHVQRRIASFELIDFAQVIDRFEKLIENGPDESYWPLLQNNIQQAQAVKDQLNRAINADLAIPDLSLLLHEDLKITQRRRLLFFGSMKVTVTVVEEGGPISAQRNGVSIFTTVPTETLEKLSGSVTITQGGPEYHYSLPTAHATGGTGDGTLELYLSISPYGSYRLMIISKEGRAVAIVARGFTDSSMKEEVHSLKSYVTSQQEIEYSEKSGQRALERVIRSDYFLSTEIDHLRTHLPKAIEELYTTVALSRVPDDKLLLCRQTMERHGLYEVLGRDFALIRSLAIISNCCSVTPQKSEIEQLLLLDEVSLEKVMSELSICTQKYGLPEVVEFNNYIFSHV